MREEQYDKEHLNRLIIARMSMVRRYAQQMIPVRLRSLIDADDIRQETYITACKGLDGFSTQNGVAALDAWLRRITERRVLTAIKSATTKKRGGDMKRIRHGSTTFGDLLDRIQTPTKSPSSEMRGQERELAVFKALQGLPEIHGKVITLRYIEGLSFREIADIVDMTEGAVRAQHKRSMTILRNTLGGKLDDWFSDVGSVNIDDQRERQTD